MGLNRDQHVKRFVCLHQCFSKCGPRPTGGPRNIFSGPRRLKSTDHKWSAASIGTVTSGPWKFHKDGLCGWSWNAVLALVNTWKLRRLPPLELRKLRRLPPPSNWENFADYPPSNWENFADYPPSNWENFADYPPLEFRKLRRLPPLELRNLHYPPPPSNSENFAD